ncbi:MAG: acetoacetate--CoA ligase [Candidatus Neomarinimicrobiota bacterium]
MKKVLWRPDSQKKTKMAELTGIINHNHGQKVNSYEQLHDWSVNHIPDFWEEVWNYCDIVHSEPYTEVVDNIKTMPGAKWFSGAKLNFAENLLRFRDDRVAIKFKSEDKSVRELTYLELFQEVEKISHYLRELGVQKGDRVVGFLPNVPEAVMAMLATSSIGAVWSSCSPDFGIKGVLDRFSQIEPKVIFSADGYRYNGKYHDSLKKLNGILKELPTVQKVILINDIKMIDMNFKTEFISYKEILECTPNPLQFEQLPFDHPLYIMYSSGTTGLPKSIVHSSGGTLLQHMKELHFHCDLNREDTIFYFTTCSWMMWNWLVSALSIGSTVVLFDGSPFYPDGKEMWKLAEELEFSVFGTSAKYIDACRENNIFPSTFSNLPKLRSILSTGSPLVEESFEYIYEHVKKDVHLASISGGTDIISCFALGSPTLEVTIGELQCRGLGMDVHSYDEKGQPIIGEKGELVCTSAFPSMPVYFWNDSNGSKYKDAYFSTFSGVWYHGDFIRISESGSLKIYGRSDSTLNPGGVRIGTSEIYRVVNSIDIIEDSLAIGQEWEGDQRIILFVLMANDLPLDKEIKNQIKFQIKNSCSPRHVPSKIIKVKGIPYTINGKKVEIAVMKIIEGKSVTNKDALSNPEALDQYKNIPELMD